MSRPHTPEDVALTPIPNSYWVKPGRLLAGEYPIAGSADRIHKLLRAGVTAFIDLTRDGELAPYVSLLPPDGSVSYERWPIVDHGLPESPQQMRQILDAIDALLEAGRCVYVHCRAGIGRTGTVMGCHLIRGGLASDAALEQLNQFWQQCARSRGWPSVPETDEQYNYVRDWREPASASPGPVSGNERREGALLGLVIGDGLGSLRVSTGGLRIDTLDAQTLPAIALGANAAMTLCVMNSLVERGGEDANDQMQRYLEWSRGAGGDVPADVRRALAAWQWSRKPQAGSHDPANLHPHSLARCLAAALYEQGDPGAAMNLAVEISRTTQQSPVVLDLCRLWTVLFVDALAGAARTDVVNLRTPSMALLKARRLRKEVKNMIEEGWRAAVRADRGDALSVTARALAAFEDSQDFVQVMRKALAAPAASDTVGALSGALAAAVEGSAAIPTRWQQSVPQGTALRSLTQQVRA